MAGRYGRLGSSSADRYASQTTMRNAQITSREEMYVRRAVDEEHSVLLLVSRDGDSLGPRTVSATRPGLESRIAT